MESVTLRLILAACLSVTLSLALPYQRSEKWWGFSKKGDAVMKMSQGFGSKFVICPDMKQCWGDKVCCRTRGNIKYVCCPGNKPDCCNKDVIDPVVPGSVVQPQDTHTQHVKEQTAYAGDHEVVQTENVGLECDGIQCNSQLFNTCCYSKLIHHWYCCTGQQDNKIPTPKKTKPKKQKITSNEDLPYADNIITPPLGGGSTITKVGAREGFDCDGIECNPQIFSSCCYSPVIHHGYCC